MGELLFCHEPIAALPFYVESVGVNLYSMEELCYYIAGNTYLLDRSFMGEELCTWVEHEMGLYKLAEQLRDAKSLSQFVGMILESTAYYSQKENEEIVLVVRQMEEKTDFECGKLRADRLMENEKYLNAVYEYQRLLDLEEAKGESPLLVGAIWHNLGTACARLFLFGEAIRCYDNAYGLNQSEKSQRAALLCCLCMQDEEGFRERARAACMDENEMQALRDEFSSAGEKETAALGNKEFSDLILTWKQDYRKNCRM